MMCYHLDLKTRGLRKTKRCCDLGDDPDLQQGEPGQELPRKLLHPGRCRGQPTKQLTNHKAVFSHVNQIAPIRRQLRSGLNYVKQIWRVQVN